MSLFNTIAKALYVYCHKWAYPSLVSKDKQQGKVINWSRFMGCCFWIFLALASFITLITWTVWLMLTGYLIVGGVLLTITLLAAIIPIVLYGRFQAIDTMKTLAGN
jgi:magnesium-transporting ATPase (P-type)